MTSPVHTRVPWVVPFAGTLAAMFALQLSNLGFSPLLPSIQQDFAMSYTQLGLFTGIYGLLALVLSVPAGIGARRFGEKRLLAAGLVGVALGSVLLSEAWDFRSALAFRGLTIFAYRFGFVSVLIAVTLTAPARLHGRTMGVVGATSALASVVGAPLGGILVTTFGWRTAILGYAATTAASAVVFWTAYATPGDVAAPRAVSAHGEVSRSAFRMPVAWLLALIIGLGGFGQFTVTNFVPSVARANYGLDAAAAGVIISGSYLAAIVLNLFVGWLADRFDRVIVLGAVFVLLASASWALTVDDVTIFRAATTAVIGLGFTASNQLYGLAGSLMPKEEAGHAMGIASLGAGLFGFFGPQLLGILRDWTGSFDAGFAVVAAADVLTLGLIVVLYRMTRSPSRHGTAGPGLTPIEGRR